MDVLDKHLDEVVNRYWNYAGRCDDPKDAKLNAALGLAGEAGEVADFFKKYYYHTAKPFKREAFVSEMGDVIFYWLKLADLCGVPHTEILEYNRKKLDGRHPEMNKEGV